MRNKAVFLDKDGTLIHDVPYNVDPEKIRLMPGVIKGLKLLRDNGYQLIGVSNQSGIARGYFEEEDVQEVFSQLQLHLHENGVPLDHMYYCPHLLQGSVKQYAVDCHCRKPKAGMLIDAAGEYNISLSHSWMIGDILHDIQAGKNAGCKTIMVDNGNETEWVQNDLRTPDFIVNNFYDAAQIIIQMDIKLTNPSIKGVMNL